MGDALHHGADPAGASALCAFAPGRGQSPEIMVNRVNLAAGRAPGIGAAR